MTTGTRDDMTANGNDRRRQTARATEADDQDGSTGGSDGAAARLRSGATAAAEAIPEVASRIRETATTVADRLPDAMTSARTTALETADTIRDMPEPTRRSLAALSIGLGIGLSLAGAPRLLIIAALTPALFSALVVTMDARGIKPGLAVAGGGTAA